MTSEKNTLGFTLLELVIVVAIIGVISAIAYPSYIESVKKSRRAEAKGALMGLSSSMTRWFAQNSSSYLGAASGGANTGSPAFFSSTVPLDGGTATYNLSIQAATATSFTIRATPTGVQAGDGYLELTHTGAKSWDKNNDSDTSDTDEDNWDD